jgi:peptide/nickel transport system permease protein
MTTAARIIPPAAEAVTGVQLAQGVGIQPAKGFWADAWSQVLKRPAAIAALAWLGIVAFLAVFAPLIGSGHPLIFRELDDAGGVVAKSYPLFRQLRSADVILILGALIAVPWILLAPKDRRSTRLGAAIFAALVAAVVVIGSSFVQSATLGRDVSGLARQIKDLGFANLVVPCVFAVVAFALAMTVPILTRPRRITIAGAACLLAILSVAATWDRPQVEVFNYLDREAAGTASGTYTLVPWSPSQRFSELNRKPPGTTLGAGRGLAAGTPGATNTFYLGTDAFGQDVLSQLLSASRLAISIGLVSTGIATLIGVTLGALMGYFGGWVDMLLFRVVEVFMAVPLLFLLIVAAAVLPPDLRTVYTMMVIIGCFTWTSAARFTRAEFLKLRSQDFVQSARAVGLPLRSILFKHMLPNGVTPVLVDASFGVAAAITIEATLSFLGLGPVDRPSWGKLLSNATNPEGEFKWWLAIFPGVAIFLTVLSYNLIGEAMRDAIDPKLKKARV